MRIAIVGGGLAGVLLAWRLTQSPYRQRPDLFIGNSLSGTDATSKSGGLIRAFESDPTQCGQSASSMAELLASPMLRAWSDYREVGSIYALRAGVDPTSLSMAADAVPGSITLTKPWHLAATHPLRHLPHDVSCVVERRAGYFSPDSLRASVIRQIAVDGTAIHRETVAAVLPDPAVRLSDGTVDPYDILVTATGAWTPSLLERSALPTAGFRTKQIQYLTGRASISGLGAFVDETSGFYGRPDGRGLVLIGLPTDNWDLEPDTCTPDPDLIKSVLAHADSTFGSARLNLSIDSVVAAADCYSDQPGLRLRNVLGDSPLYTFTAGSGAGAKSVLAASRAAAAALMS